MSRVNGTTESLVERLPPQSKPTEQAILGSILRDNSVMDDVLIIVRPEHFYYDAHQRLLATMIAMYDKSKAIDLVTLAERLKDQGQIEDIGGYEYLGELWDASPTAAHVEHYATIVRDKSIQRSLIQAATEILRDAYEPPGSAQELLETCEKKILRVAEIGATRNNTFTMKQVMVDVLDRIDERSRNTERTKGVTTGLADLDEKTGGWQKGEFAIVAARPSTGKTAITSTFASAAGLSGAKVMYFSLEQSRVELGERFLVAASEVDSRILRTGPIMAEHIGRMVDASYRLNELPIFFDDRPGQTYLEIASKARRMKRRHDIDLVIIDYLQLIVSDDRRAPRHEQVSEISRRLKDLARELQIPIVCLAQLNRESENRADHRPKVSDLRESGSIEQDADVVILLHRPEMHNPADRPNEADLIIAKQRNGPTGDVPVSYQKQWMRFSNLQYGDPT